MKRLALAVVVVVSLGQVEGAVLYSVTDLGDLPGGEDVSHAMAVNNKGQVVGLSGAAGGTRAFLWQNGVMTNLDTLTSEHDWSVARDINDAGQIVGSSRTIDVSLSQRPFVYNNGTMTGLGSFGGDYGFALGINTVGQVVGLSRYSNGVTRAFLWENGSMTDLGDFGDPYSAAYDINNNSQIVGNSVLNGADRGFTWENGVMTDLGDLPGGPERTRAYDINNLGQVVGESGVPSPSFNHAFLWENGVMTDLGVWPGTNMSLAEGINDSGLAVGTSFNYDLITKTGEDHRAFVWDSVNGMQDLNDLLDSSGAGWTLEGTRDISNAGYIVGWGTNPDGSQHGYLLTPIPEPNTLLIWSVLGLAGIVCYRKRQKK